MAFESMDLGCIECQFKMTDLIERAHRDEWFSCPKCGEQSLRRMLSAPNIRTSDSATFLDGTRKFTGLKEQVAISKEARSQKAADKRAKLVLQKESK